ncbi:MAG: ArsA family ATPase [Candidatus Dormibacteria bacterium]
MRVILYTGKGGVGKTSVSAATAVRAARRGLRTLVMSTDTAHSLGDSLDLELDRGRAVQVAPNLWAHEVDALQELEQHWARIHRYLTALIASQGLDEVIAEEVSSPPGMEEVASLMWIRHYVKKGEHDLLVVDCAPTGETMQLLAFPDVARWWLEKIFPLQRQLMRMARPVVQPFVNLPLPKDDIYQSVRSLLLDLDGMREILADRSTTTVRLVLNLEKMVIKEAQRAYTYLSLFGYVTDAVIVNRVLPAEVRDHYFDRWHEVQKDYRAHVEQAFAPLPLLDVPLFDREVVGLEMLDRMAGEVFGDLDPAALLYAGSHQHVEREGDGYLLRVRVPFANREDIHLSESEGDLMVRVGPYRREISLPRVLRGRRTSGARLEDGELTIRFGER